MNSGTTVTEGRWEHFQQGTNINCALANRQILTHLARMMARLESVICVKG